MYDNVIQPCWVKRQGERRDGVRPRAGPCQDCPLLLGPISPDKVSLISPDHPSLSVRPMCRRQPEGAFGARPELHAVLGARQDLGVLGRLRPVAKGYVAGVEDLPGVHEDRHALVELVVEVEIEVGPRAGVVIGIGTEGGEDRVLLLPASVPLSHHGEALARERDAPAPAVVDEAAEIRLPVAFEPQLGRVEEHPRSAAPIRPAARASGAGSFRRRR